MFSDYFSSVCAFDSKILDVESLPFDDLPNRGWYFMDLKKLKGNRSVGLDGLLGDFIYEIRSALSFSLWILFNYSPRSHLPFNLKILSITPYTRIRRQK